MKRALFFASLLLALASCEKDPDFGKLSSDLVVYSDCDAEARFGDYATYFLPDSILDVASREARYWKDENALSIIGEVERQMDACGYTRITDPERKAEADLGVQVSYVSETNQVVTGGYPGYWGGWWDYGFWGSWWGGWYYPYPVTYSYDTNTLILEMVDLTSAQGAQQAGEEGEAHRLPVVWYATAHGYQHGNNRVNMRLLLDGVAQAFRQSAYLGRSNGADASND